MDRPRLSLMGLVSYSLVQVCHIWLSLLAACVGGVLARLLDHIRPRSNRDDLGPSIPAPGAAASPSERMA